MYGGVSNLWAPATEHPTPIEHEVELDLQHVEEIAYACSNILPQSSIGTYDVHGQITHGGTSR